MIESSIYFNDIFLYGLGNGIVFDRDEWVLDLDFAWED